MRIWGSVNITGSIFNFFDKGDTSTSTAKPINKDDPPRIQFGDAKLRAGVAKQLGSKGESSEAIRIFEETLRLIDPAQNKYADPQDEKLAKEAMAGVMNQMVWFYWWDSGNPQMADYYGKQMLKNPCAALRNEEGRQAGNDNGYQVLADLFDINKYYYSGFMPQLSLTTENSGEKKIKITEFNASTAVIMPSFPPKGNNRLTIGYRNRDYGDGLNVNSIFFKEPVEGIPEEEIGKEHPILGGQPVNTINASYSVSTGFINGIFGVTSEFVNQFIRQVGIEGSWAHTSTNLLEYIYSQDIYNSINGLYQKQVVAHPFSTDRLGYSATMETLNWKIGETDDRVKYLKCWFFTGPIFNYKKEWLNRNADSIYSYIHETDASGKPVLDKDGNFTYPGVRASNLESTTTSVGFRLTTRKWPAREDGSGVTVNFRHQWETNRITNTNDGIAPEDPEGPKQLSSWHLGIDWAYPLGRENSTLQHEGFLTLNAQCGQTDLDNMTGWNDQPNYYSVWLGYKKGAMEYSFGVSGSTNGIDPSGAKREKAYSATTVYPLKLILKY